MLGALIYVVSCSNPEDRATGNPDSTKFNSDEKKTLNTNPGPTTPNQSDVAKPDTSVSTKGNRAYRDSIKHK